MPGIVYAAVLDAISTPTPFMPPALLRGDPAICHSSPFIANLVISLSRRSNQMAFHHLRGLIRLIAQFYASVNNVQQALIQCNSLESYQSQSCSYTCHRTSQFSFAPTFPPKISPSLHRFRAVTSLYLCHPRSSTLYDLCVGDIGWPVNNSYA